MICVALVALRLLLVSTMLALSSATDCGENCTETLQSRARCQRRAGEALIGASGGLGKVRRVGWVRVKARGRLPRLVTVVVCAALFNPTFVLAKAQSWSR